MSDRHRFRADWHDYNDGIFFVTICARDYRHFFGSISEYEFHPTALGKLIDEHINSIPSHHDDVEIYNYVLMPNHIHIVMSVGTRIFASAATERFFATENPDNQLKNLGCLKPPRHDEPTLDFHHNSRISLIIGAFKAGVTRDASKLNIADEHLWQPRFHDHIIRNQQAYEKIMNYVDTNVQNWDKDCFR